jgi:hypothetical protein
MALIVGRTSVPHVAHAPAEDADVGRSGDGRKIRPVHRHETRDVRLDPSLNEPVQNAQACLAEGNLDREALGIPRLRSDSSNILRVGASRATIKRIRGAPDETRHGHKSLTSFGFELSMNNAMFAPRKSPTRCERAARIQPIESQVIPVQ